MTLASKSSSGEMGLPPFGSVSDPMASGSTMMPFARPSASPNPPSLMVKYTSLRLLLNSVYVGIVQPDAFNRIVFEAISFYIGRLGEIDGNGRLITGLVHLHFEIQQAEFYKIRLSV